MTWHVFSGSYSQWDQLTIDLGSTSPYQSSAWSRFRSGHGWTAGRLVTDDDRCAVQVLTKTVLGVTLAWAPGGPIGDISTDAVTDLATRLRLHLRASVLYLRLSDFRAWTPERNAVYLANGWQSPRTKLSTSLTSIRELQNDDALLASHYSKNWSRNLRRGVERGITATLWEFPDAATLAQLHQEVVEIKHLSKSDWRVRTADVSRLIQSFGNQLVIVKAVAPDGSLAAIRGAVVVGTVGFDFLAATTAEGRKTYASNVALHHLLHILGSRNIQRYDFGGVDPKFNKGVYDFKHGAGGLESRYVGEYETVIPNFLRIPISTLVSSRLSK